MKYILFFLLLLITNTSIFAQDNIQPKWGVSYCSGRIRGYSMRPNPGGATPLSKDWTYSALSAYYIFHIKKISFQTGLEMQRTKTFFYYSAKYPYIVHDIKNLYLGYSQLVYNFLPSKRISPYLGIGCASRIIDYNTVFGEGGVNIQPKSDFPLFIGLKGHLSRAFFSRRMGVGLFDYLDNVAFGLSVQYAFKANKQTKDK